MTYADYKKKMGDLIVAGTPAVHAHWIAIAGEGLSHDQADILWAMFVTEHQ